MGNIDALARTIVEFGLLHPIVIKPDGTLIAGARRLAAYNELGRDVIPVTVIDLEKIVLGEYGRRIGKDLGTIKHWRAAGRCPPYVKIGRSIFYREAAIEAWLASMEIDPKLAPKAAAAVGGEPWPKM